MTATFQSLRVEFQKIRRSKTLWITALVFAFITIICGLFMFILKDPEQAHRLGLLGAKAEIFGGSADWPSFFNLILVVMSVGGMVIFGFIFVWIFGREFGDRTVDDLLALPTSRLAIVSAKTIIAALWSVTLILLVFLLMLVIGAILQLPGFSINVALDGLESMLITGLLAAILCIPFALLASITRSYLPAVGCIFLVLVLGQVFSTLGYGQYFPWAVPGLYSGAAEALTGKAATPPDFISYLLVVLVSVLSLITMNVWWQYADHT